jgi:hypothetical protein
MRINDLPERWQIRLKQYTESKYGADYKWHGEISARDFNCGSIVHINLPDGSHAFFKYAFFIELPEWKEVAVFTEHCGYHIFPLIDTEICRYEQKHDVINTKLEEE